VVSLLTPRCHDLEIEYPVFSVGFGTGAGPELVAAVSNAGGYGVPGAVGLTPEEIRRKVVETRELTDRPFAVNLIIAELEDPDTPEEYREEVREQIETAIAERVSAIVFFWGDPAPFVDAAHGSGVKVLIQVGSVEEASSAAEAGVDAVIAQGVEAGGHVRGTTSVWQLLPAAVNAVAPVPVLVSGGIGDGTGIARALTLGAQGVSLGTRFVANDEAWIHPAHKLRVVESTADHTVLSDLYDVWWPDAPHRTLRTGHSTSGMRLAAPRREDDPGKTPRSEREAHSRERPRSGRATRLGWCRPISRAMPSACQC
jgi:NAD(P)H-dependent flavin oxidoreductase YrpB (nitropropane dioxygenase family)